MIQKENKNVTLLYSSKEKEYNQVVVLLEVLESF